VRLPAAARVRVAADPNRAPRYLRGGALRLLLVCLAVWGIEMLPLRLDRERAGALVLGSAVLLAAVAIAVTSRFQAYLHSLDLPLVARGVARAEAIFMLMRRVGILLLALAFFLFWTIVYVGCWWWDPTRSFTGLASRPRFADFFYTSVSTAFISPPGDILATSRGARSATMTEMITGAALLSTYLSTFVDWRLPSRTEPLAPQEPGGPGSLEP
jgi:hypothetical protein